jgi:hypothetical protein
LCGQAPFDRLGLTSCESAALIAKGATDHVRGPGSVAARAESPRGNKGGSTVNHGNPVGHDAADPALSGRVQGLMPQLKAELVELVAIPSVSDPIPRVSR